MYSRSRQQIHNTISIQRRRGEHNNQILQEKLVSRDAARAGGEVTGESHDLSRG